MVGSVAFVLLLAGALANGQSCVSKDARIIRRNNLSCGNKQYILDFHNKIRNFVASGRINGQPKAANMMEMRWNDALADLAQVRADTCIFDHGDFELNGERVGQNLAIVTSTANSLRLNITHMIDLWYNEVFQFGYKGGFEPNSGHYSQLIWGSTREVGCGYTYYEEDGWYKMYFVCDYYPPGNYINQKPYDFDKYDCRKYGMLESRKYNKLCAIDFDEIPVCKTDPRRPERLTDGSGENRTQAGEANPSSAGPGTEFPLPDISAEDDMEDVSNVTTEESATSSNGTLELQEDEYLSNSTSEVRLDNSIVTAEVTTPAEREETTKASDEGKIVGLGERNGSLVILNCNQAMPPVKLDWKDKEDFFRAATKLLDLLISRKIYINSQNVISTDPLIP